MGGGSPEGRRPVLRAALWAALWGGGVFTLVFALGMMVVGSEARAVGVGGIWGGVVFSVVLWRRLKRKGTPMTTRGCLGLLAYVTAVALFLLLWVRFWASRE